LLPNLSGGIANLRDLAKATNAAGERMIRTPAWHLKLGKQAELYAKADDRWEANDVASRCADIVQLLSDLAERRDSQTALPEELFSPWR
jgi:hypothetical protein